MSRFVYTKKHLRFLEDGYLKMNARDLARSFNARFGKKKTETAIKSALTNHGIKCGRKGGEKLITPRLYTTEHERFVRDLCPHVSKQELVERFNNRFGMQITLGKMKALMGNRKINSGRTGCFPKGHKSWNYGTKGQGLTGPNRTSFKKGNMPPNRKPLWSERVNVYGYIEIKVPERDPYTGFPTRYKLKHKWLWEQEHGPVPSGHVVAFRDGDKLNCRLENLMLISRNMLARLNQIGYGDAPPEIKPSIIALAELRVRAGEAKRIGDERAAL